LRGLALSEVEGFHRYSPDDLLAQISGFRLHYYVSNSTSELSFFSETHSCASEGLVFLTGYPPVRI
ncbi:MAG: hypothetical protein G01um101433_883, partial [Parcubacteria group bacterium Gr01-1014_33]